MSEPVFLWIKRWEEFQHYPPERDRAPAWIKAYTKQLDDDRYLRLTDRQRALLGDLRVMFALAHGQLGVGSASPDGHVTVNARAITRRRNAHTLGSDIMALNHAGLIDFCSRETLDQHLEEFYTRSRPSRARGEGEKRENIKFSLSSSGEKRSKGEPADEAGGLADSPTPNGTKPTLRRARAFVERLGREYPSWADLKNELTTSHDQAGHPHFPSLTPTDLDELRELHAQLHDPEPTSEHAD